MWKEVLAVLGFAASVFAVRVVHGALHSLSFRYRGNRLGRDSHHSGLQEQRCRCSLALNHVNIRLVAAFLRHVLPSLALRKAEPSS